jgi:hypothetical protein
MRHDEISDSKADYLSINPFDGTDVRRAYLVPNVD